MVNLAEIVKSTEYKSSAEHLQEEIHDTLRVYYQLPLDRFVDNVFQLSIDYYLLHGPHSPLRTFTQEWVVKLESEGLGEMAGEARSTKKSRSKLMKKIHELGAVNILKEWLIITFLMDDDWDSATRCDICARQIKYLQISESYRHHCSEKEEYRFVS